MLDKEQQTIFYEKLGENIREARKRQNLNQEELGDKLGMSRVSIVNIETGKQRLPIHVLGDISDILKIKISEMVPEVKGPQGQPPQALDMVTMDKIRKESEENSDSPEKVIKYLTNLNKQ